MDMIIVDYDSCGKCIHSCFDESNIAKILVYCTVKDKNYIYGSCIPCEYFERKKND